MTHALGKNTDVPRIAAIEISGREGSVVLAEGSQVVAETTLSPALRHAAELMPALQRLCAQRAGANGGAWMVGGSGGAPRLAIEQLYLSLGPGSFTGLRIAVAIARGLAQAIGCRLIGVPSLAVIAENVPAEFGVAVPVLDAKRGEVFAARFERNAPGKWACVSGPALVDPAKFLAEAIASAAQRGESRVAVLGDGIDYHRAAIQSAGIGEQIVELDRALWIPKASVVHRLGWEMAQRGEFASPQTLLPIYIRLPEAEEVWRRKHPAPTGEVSQVWPRARG